MAELFHGVGGEAAALATSVLWAFTAIFFTLASLRIGSYTVNRVRLIIAVLLLGTTHLALYGSFLPLDAGAESWAWLGISGLVGLTLGDTLLFESLVELGTQRAMLVMASWPILAALMAFLFMGERLSARELLGVVITLTSIAWVVTGGAKADAYPAMEPQRRPLRGGLLAFGGAACQAAGVLMAKQGLVGELPALSGTVIRMAVAAVGLWTVSLFRKDIFEAARKLRDGRGALFTACGAVFGPFLGVWLSLLAVKYAKVGIAAALMSLPPVLLIPLGRWIFHDKITLRAVLGTVGALSGAWLLFIK